MNENLASKAERQSNIELLRIISILGVIVLHYNNRQMGGGMAYAEGNINLYLLYILESFSICAVNLFVLISGYFLCRTKNRNLWKLIELIVQVILFKLSAYLLKVVFTDESLMRSAFIDCVIPANYFVILYSAVYIISPYVNILLENLTRKQMRTFVITLLTLFSVYPTLVDIFGEITGKQYGGLSTIGAYGSQWGYSVVNFALMYILGAYLRSGVSKLEKARTKSIVLALLACVGILTLWANVNDTTAWEYCNPIVILSAVFTMALFLRFRIGYSRIINRMAEGTFSVFLLHHHFLPYIGIAHFATGNPIVMIGHILISAGVIYVICWVAHCVYSVVTKPIFRKLSELIRLPDLTT